MRKLFRIRLTGLLLLSTLVCMASFLAAHRDYVKTTHRWVLRPPAATGPMPSSRWPSTPSGTVVTLKPNRQAETRLDYDLIRRDVVGVGSALLAIYALIVWLNRRERRHNPLRPSP